MPNRCRITPTLDLSHKSRTNLALLIRGAKLDPCALRHLEQKGAVVNGKPIPEVLRAFEERGLG